MLRAGVAEQWRPDCPPDMPTSPAHVLIEAIVSVRRAWPCSHFAATARTGSSVAASCAAAAKSPPRASAVYSRIGCHCGVWYRYGAAEDMNSRCPCSRMFSSQVPSFGSQTRICSPTRASTFR